MTNPTLGAFGVFRLFQQWQQLSAAQLKDIEALGYGAIWAGGSPPAELDWVESILEATEKLKVATGIVNIWSSAAGRVAESFHRIEAAHPGPVPARYRGRTPRADRRIQETLRRTHRVPRQARRVWRARGPARRRRARSQMLKLAARRSAGAHPYLTTPEHTVRARNLIGPDAFLAPEHKVC